MDLGLVHDASVFHDLDSWLTTFEEVRWLVRTGACRERLHAAGTKKVIRQGEQHDICRLSIFKPLVDFKLVNLGASHARR